MKTTQFIYSRRLLSLFTFISLIFLLNACSTTQASLKARESSVKRLRSELRALKEAHTVAVDYHQHLKDGQGKVLLIGKRDLEKAFTPMFPYTYQGRDLSKKYLTGEISFVKMTEFKLLPGNRAEFVLHFDGRKIKSKNVPAIAQSQVKSLKQAVQGGGMLVEVRAFINNQKGLLVLDPEAVGVKFDRNNTSSNQSRFLDAVNKKIFNRSKSIPLPTGLKGSAQALSTPHHLIILSK